MKKPSGEFSAFIQVSNLCRIILDTLCLILIAGRMTLASDVNLEEYIMAKDDLSGADIKAICTEAGLMALRERRMRVIFRPICLFLLSNSCMFL